MLAELMQMLARSPLFTGIDSEDLLAVLDCLKPTKTEHEKGECIAIAGEPIKGVGVIAAGRAAVVKDSAAGDSMVMTILEPGDLFGEIAAFAEEPRWTATVQAQEDSTVFIIPQDRIVGRCAENCRRHQLLTRNMLKIVSNRALMLNQKVTYLTMRGMRQRISAFLLDHYERMGRATFDLPLNRNEMAAFLGVSRPSMSREISRMKDDGLIDFHLSTFRLLDLDGLRRCVMSGQ